MRKGRGNSFHRGHEKIRTTIMMVIVSDDCVVSNPERQQIHPMQTLLPCLPSSSNKLQIFLPFPDKSRRAVRLQLTKCARTCQRSQKQGAAHQERKQPSKLVRYVWSEYTMNVLFRRPTI